MPRIIAHIDMDAFFAAIEERDNPRFKNMPIVIGSDPAEGKGRGVVSTANYKAREYGIRSATPISKAWKFSENARKKGKPAAIFLPVDFEKYRNVSGKVFDIVKKYSKNTEEASIDEAYFDLSFAGSFLQAKNICEKIKKEIKNKENLTASIGIGPNKLIAKIASDFQKPDGLTVVKKEETEKFLFLLPVRKIPGVGPKTENALLKRGVKKIEDLKKISENELIDLFGKWGKSLYEKARGIDESDICAEYEIKSAGEQMTFLKDTLDVNFILEKAGFMCDNIIKRLRKEGFKGFYTIVATVRFSDFETKSKSRTFPKALFEPGDFRAKAIKMIIPFFDARENPKKKKIRLVGIRAEKLEK